MKIEEAKAHVGKLVMSRDPGFKMIPSVREPHGPYRLLSVTKSGDAILETREELRVRPSLLTPYEQGQP